MDWACRHTLGIPEPESGPCRFCQLMQSSFWVYSESQCVAVIHELELQGIISCRFAMYPIGLQSLGMLHESAFMQTANLQLQSSAGERACTTAQHPGSLRELLSRSMERGPVNLAPVQCHMPSRHKLAWCTVLPCDKEARTRVQRPCKDGGACKLTSACKLALTPRMTDLYTHVIGQRGLTF